jgi:hypothetical protein
MSNPPVSPGNTVADLTPTLDWALSGRTQEAFELRLYQFDGTTSRLIWRLPRTVSATTAYTIPKGYIKTGEEYHISLLVWDTVDRAVTPGDNDYAILGRDFSYARAGGPDPVINLTATVFGPLVQLTWHRSADPTYFTIKRNGVEVIDRIVPADVFTSTSGGVNAYDLMGSRRPVQIVDSIAGYAGTVSGVLLNQAQRDVAETLIGRTPTPLRLILADMNIEVELEDGSPTPTPIPTRDIFNVTFDWYQTDASESFTVTGGGG